MDKQNDIMNIINLLAGAAQAGARGALAQAALNLIKATEAKQKAGRLNDADDMVRRADELVQETRNVFLELANDTAALEEGKQDIVAAGGKPYRG